MKKQELITESSEVDFSNLVNRKLRDGWHVVPGTIAIAGAANSVAGSSYCHLPPVFHFAVVVEEE